VAVLYTRFLHKLLCLIVFFPSKSSYMPVVAIYCVELIVFGFQYGAFT